MYAWEKPFHAVVAAVRGREVKQVYFASYVGGIYLRYIFKFNIFLGTIAIHIFSYT